MTTEQLDNILGDAAAEFPVIVGDLSTHIREAAAAVLEESQDDEKAKATLTVGISLKIDLTKSPPTWWMESAVGVRRKVKGDVHTSEATPHLPGLEGKGGRS